MECPVVFEANNNDDEKHRYKEVDNELDQYHKEEKEIDCAKIERVKIKLILQTIIT